MKVVRDGAPAGASRTAAPARQQALARLLSRELVQRLLPDMPGTGQAGLIGEFWVEAISDRLATQDWLNLRALEQRFEPVGDKGKLEDIRADSHDQQTTEGRMP